MVSAESRGLEVAVGNEVDVRHPPTNAPQSCGHVEIPGVLGFRVLGFACWVLDFGFRV